VADELPPAVAQFIADSAAYIPPIDEMIDKTNQLADAQDRVKDVNVKATADVTDADTKLQEVQAQADKLAGTTDSIKVTGDISDADAKLQTVQAEADKVASTADTIKVTADITDADAKFATVQAEADKVAGTAANIKVTADVSDVTAKLDQVKAEEAALSDKTIHITVDTSDADSKLSALGNVGDEAATKLDHVRSSSNVASDALKDVGDKSQESSTLMDLMGGSTIKATTSFAGLIGPIAAAVAAAVPLAPAFIGASGGVAAFGAMAAPTIMGVVKNMQMMSDAQQKYDTAATASAKNKALAQIKADWASIPPEQQQVITAIQGFEKEFNNLAKALQPDILSIFNKGLDVLRTILPSVQGLAIIAGNALDQMMTVIQQHTPQIIDFIHQLGQLAQVALPAIGQLTGSLINLFVQLTTALAPVATPLINFFNELVKALTGPLVAAFKVLGQLMLALGQAITPLLPSLSQLATALITDIGAAFQSITPVVTQIIQILGKDLIAILQAAKPIIENFLTPNSPFISALKMIPGLLNAINPLIQAFIAVLSNPIVSRIAVDILSAVAAFKGLQLAIGLVTTAASGISSAFTFIVGIPAMIRGAVQAFKDLEIAQKAATAAQWLLDAAMDANPIGAVILLIVGLVAAFVILWVKCAAFRDFWKGIWNDVVGAIQLAGQLIEAAWNTVVSFLTSAILGMPQAFEQVVSAAEAIWNGFVSYMKGIWNTIQSDATSAWNSFTNFITNAVTGLVTVAESQWNGLVSYLSGIWNTIQSDATSAWNSFTNFITNAVTGLVTVAESQWNGLVSYLSGIWNSISSNAESAWNSFVSWFQGIPGQIVNAFANLPAQMVNIGTNIINGLINGISSAATGLFNYVTQVANSVVSTFANAIASISPSKKFHQQGEYIIQGLVNGMRYREHEAHDFMRRFGRDLQTSFAVTPGLVNRFTGTNVSAFPGLGSATGYATSGGGGNVIQNFNIQGSVVAETTLRQIAQQGVLRYTRRNPGNGWFLAGRQS